MRFLAFVLGLGMMLMSSEVLAQESVDSTTAEVSDWKLGGGIGFDFAQLLQINPKPGAGDNRIGLGGLSNWFANYNKDNINWESHAKAMKAFGPRKHWVRRWQQWLHCGQGQSGPFGHY